MGANPMERLLLTSSSALTIVLMGLEWTCLSLLLRSPMCRLSILAFLYRLPLVSPSYRQELPSSVLNSQDHFMKSTDHAAP
ncbi:hypothetical protein PoB_001812900 [Plakobranchus ocellatus]|uniref:Uncharacterized protein n=1 Tax=Plakobranchus ocellatus TaxID=259542 RepID=A0AAV3ZB61_9GAST|nr:hypothetical protein PoB_001812900 [Plakobranchus ocellatus]